eukprot:3194120-Prymnesium_polylepis.1
MGASLRSAGCKSNTLAAPLWMADRPPGVAWSKRMRHAVVPLCVEHGCKVQLKHPPTRDTSLSSCRAG